MRTSALLSVIAAFFLVIVITVVGCNSNSKMRPLISKDTLDPHLYNLWIRIDSIKKSNIDTTRRLILNYCLDSTNIFTLRGWVPAGKDTSAANTFLPSVIKLNIGKLSNDSLKIHKGTFIGNLAIRRGIVKSIVNNSAKKKFLVLIPVNSSGNIVYKLVLTDNNYMVSNIETKYDVPIGQANPTPPRNYNGNN